jgi:predicted membrane-bound spermidine synthase
MNSNIKKTLYLLSFIEGGAVMATELLGVKMMAPYFGSSLYVWASVLAVTLGGLTIGYFWGGLLSEKENAKILLFKLTLAAAILLAFMPLTANFILGIIGGFELVPAILFSSVLILAPPLICMGMVSPILIRLLAEVVEKSGKMAGRIYAISTIGGIISTLLLGFYLIPTFGLIRLALAFGLILSIIPIIMLFKQSKALSFAFIILFSISLFASFRPPKKSNINILYKSEGLLGQLIVSDYPVYDNDGKVNLVRFLFNNRSIQSLYNPAATGNKYLAYILGVTNAVSIYPKGSKALILGIGAGGIANEFNSLGFSIDAVDLDKRVGYVARTYFDMDEKVNVIIDDGRHYIRNCKKKYNILAIDIFLAETNPSHILTKENIDEIKNIMEPDGLIIINGPGFISGKIGKGVRSVYKTLVNSGLKVKVLPTPGPEENRNILFLASFEDKNFSKNRLAAMAINDIEIGKRFLSANQIDIDDAIIFTDDIPALNILNRDANKSWRKGFIESYILEYTRKGIPLFY